MVVKHLALFLVFVGSAFGFEPLPKQTADRDLEEFFQMSPPELPLALREAKWRIPELPPPENIDELITRLGAPSYAERTAAAAELRDLGLRAGKPLLQHIRSEDPEIAQASRRILQAITADNHHHHMHLELVEEVETGKIGAGVHKMQAVECDLPEVVFAMRSIVDQQRMGQLFKRLESFERVDEIKRWYSLLAHKHGQPVFLSGFLKHGRPFTLEPAMQAYLERGSQSDYPRLNRHCRKWAVVLGHPLPDRQSPLLSPDPAIRNVAAAHFYRHQREYLESILARQMIRSEDPSRQALGLEWLSVAVFGIHGHTTTKTTWRPAAERLAPAAPFLSHAERGMRLRAAFAFLPTSVNYKPDGDSTKRLSFDNTLLTTTKGDSLLAIADWLDGEEPRPAFPGGIRSTYDADFFRALQTYAPSHMPAVLRILARDLVGLQGEARRAARLELANSLHAFRFVQLGPSEWPAEAFEILLEARMMQSDADPFSYLSQDQFASGRPDFLLPAFEVGPIPPNKGYAMLAAVSCQGDEQAIATLSKALSHPSAAHRTEAAMALSFLGEENGREAARSVLTNEAATVTLRSKAAVALAELKDKPAYPTIAAGFTSLVVRTAAPTTEHQKARARFLYSLRDARPPEAEAFVKMRLSTSRCPHSMHVAGRNYCAWCSRDKVAVKALALQWNMLEAIPEELDRDHDWAFVRFLLDEKIEHVDIPEIEALLPVPAGKRVDLRLRAAEKIDRLTRGKTSFATIARDDPEDLADAFSKWRHSAEALPFLSKSAREDLELDLEDGDDVPLRR